MTSREFKDSAAASGTWSVGTLTYNKRQLITLFLWLMWNDFNITLLQQIGSLNGILFRDHGASYTEIAFFASAGGIIGMWLNPIVSTWSDRLRTPWGRRRPFLFFATPFFAIFLAAIPYMPDLYQHTKNLGLVSHLVVVSGIKGEVLFIGVCSFISGLFNSMVLAIFSYLYWDVVPEAVLGRFWSLSNIVTGLATFSWSFFFMGLADTHIHGVYVGVSAFCLAAYLLSVWNVKESKYPPPDPHIKGGVLAPIRAYFAECFSNPYYLWIFAGFAIFQVGLLGQSYQFYYLRYDLGMSLGTIGRITSLPSILCMVIGFGLGTLTDRLKPVRLMAPTLALWAIGNVIAYFFVRDQWSLLFCVTFINVAIFFNSILQGAFMAEVLPREKFGQFCSANAISYQLICNFSNPFIAMLFDHIKFNRLGYLWSAGFQFLSALIFVKVYLNWVARRGRTPVPHAG
jgi:maltose/moltooligosaccharide transporter